MTCRAIPASSSNSDKPLATLDQQRLAPRVTTYSAFACVEKYASLYFPLSAYTLAAPAVAEPISFIAENPEEEEFKLVKKIQARLCDDENDYKHEDRWYKTIRTWHRTS
ncbi:hypothetical protein [Nocardia iowensis]|uniref:Uncharacterized protein n=1 Tax=Nocardia iowensis TaxID=204891 RepID=A0ABX8RHR0_NOCIO|nr:hypothetical protein [Nocardia iowensis]QXN88489.1 hypothetical protein KV110_23110 [Nocardia iowensis]